MKRIIILLMVVIFTACGEPQPAPTATPEPVAPDTAEYIFLSDSGCLEMDDNGITILNDYIQGITLQALLNEKRMSDFADNGIEITLEKVVKQDNDNLLFTISFEKGGKIFAADFHCLIRYSYQPPDGQFASNCYNFSLYWGNISLYDDEIILTRQNVVQFYSLATMEKLDKAIDLSFIKWDEWYLFDVIGGKTGYGTAVNWRNDNNRILFFDAEGCYTGEVTCGTLGRAAGSDSKANHRYIFTEKVCLEWEDGDERYISGTGGLADRLTGQFHSGGGKIWENGRYKVRLFGTRRDFISDTEYFAVRYVDSQPVNLIRFEQTKFPQIECISDTQPAFNEDMTVVSFCDEEYGVNTTIDFTAGTATILPAVDGLKNTYGERVGDYQLISVVFGYYRPNYERLYLYNYATDTTVFLAQFDPNDINGEATKDYGFTDEGMVYIHGYENYAIYNPATGKEILDLSRILKRNDYSDDKFFRRIEDVITYKDGFLVSHFTTNRTTRKMYFCIDHLSKNGTLVRRYYLNTDYNFGITSIMLKDENTLSISSRDYMQSGRSSGMLDLTTGQYDLRSYEKYLPEDDE